jgi:DNA replication protein DnaC
MVTKTCVTCEEPFDALTYEINGREVFSKRVCDKCKAQQIRDLEEQRQQAALRQREGLWERICPPLYRNSDRSRIPAPFLTAASDWSYSPKGLGFVGSAGKGKTRSAFLLLQKHFFEGRSCTAISSTRLARYCMEQFSDDKHTKTIASDQISECRSADILLIDDLGKSKMTERCETELFDILEFRTSYESPTIWTANARGNELLAMMSPDRGEPILRRLAEFSEIVSAL